MTNNDTGKDISNKLQALNRRTVLIKRSGNTLVKFGVQLALVGVAAKLYSFFSTLEVTGFKLDLPDSLISSGTVFRDTSDGSNVLEVFLNLFWETPPLFNYAAMIPFALGCYLIYSIFTKPSVSLSLLPKILLIIILISAPKINGVYADLSDDGTLIRHGDVQRIIDDSEDDKNYDQLITYIKDLNPRVKPGFLPFDYVIAQIGVKEGKPDIDVIKKVIDGYNNKSPFAKVPGPIRYALEMSAFNGPVTAEAKQYQTDQLTMSALFSKSGELTAFIGAGLVLLGGGLLLLFRQLIRRVSFLKTN